MRYWLARLLISIAACLVLALTAAVGHAFDSLPSKDELDSLTKDAADIQVLSQDPQTIYAQIGDINDQISQLQARLAVPNDYQTALDALTAADANLIKLADSAGRLTCSGADHADELQDLAGEIGSQLYSIRINNNLVMSPSLAKELLDPPTSSDCAMIKERFGNQQLLNRVRELITKTRSEAEKQNGDYQDRKKTVQALIASLQAKRTEVSNALKGLKGEIGEKLWLVILVIGALGTGTILAVRLFESSIQIEWVASGQVTQFVTVMMLLSVIFGLGLSDVLKEETLGTLLGGVAGYVLSQGVGRAAAREAGRHAQPPQTQPLPNQNAVP
jgi:NTP pyrophosphatase (non-canonical NTP hydrolase)